MLKNNSKVKKVLALSFCSSAFIISGISASATMKKALTSAASTVSISSSRKTSMGSSLSTWSSYKGRMEEIKGQGSSLGSQKKLRKPDFISGKFIDPTGQESILPVYTKVSDEGLKVKYVKNQDGEDIVVTHIGSGVYSKTLSTEEARVFDQKNHQVLQNGIDTLGREKLIIVTEGTSKEMAFELDTGTWRDIMKGSNGQIYLGNQINVFRLPPDIRNKVYRDFKVITAYAAPLTSLGTLGKGE